MDSALTPTLLLLGLPSSTFCGIDLLSFTTSPKFQGIKNLPLGWHFVFTGATDAFSMRCGVWFHVDEASPAPQIFIKRWNANTESLDAVTDEQTVLHWRANLGSIWREHLTPYRQSAASSNETTNVTGKEVAAPNTSASAQEDNAYSFVDDKSHIWPSLTSKVTSQLLARITGSTTPDHYSLSSVSSAPGDIEAIPGLSHTETHSAYQDQELHFLPIDLKRTWRSGAIGRERTEAARDRSWALENLLTQHFKSTPADAESELLGELQVTFVATLVLNNTSAFEQWKRLATLLLTCRAAILTRSRLFTAFLRLLRTQLERSHEDAEGGLFDLGDADEGAGLLKALLRRFRGGLEQLSVDAGARGSALRGVTEAGVDQAEAKQDVLDELEELEEYMKEAHGWGLNEAYVKSGMIDLEDGERVPMDLNAGGEESDGEDEDGEYAPVVVDLTEEQARAMQGALGRSEGKELTLNQRRRVEAGNEVGQVEGSSDDSAGEENDSLDEEDDQDLDEMDARY